MIVCISFGKSDQITYLFNRVFLELLLETRKKLRRGKHGFQKIRIQKKSQILTILTVSSHVFARAFTGIVGHQIRTDSSIFTWIPFTFIDICKTHMHKDELATEVISDSSHLNALVVLVYRVCSVCYLIFASTQIAQVKEVNTICN